MARYEVKHTYGSARDGQRFGPWQSGDVVELDPADAEWVNRDSPGALAAVKPGKSEERQKPAGADRQHRGGANRSG